MKKENANLLKALSIMVSMCKKNGVVSLVMVKKLMHCEVTKKFQLQISCSKEQNNCILSNMYLSVLLVLITLHKYLEQQLQNKIIKT